MEIKIRRMRNEDARAFLEVHHASVRELNTSDYSSDVIEHWAPMPISDEKIHDVLANQDSEIRIVAEHEEVIIGIGAVVLHQHELRACYVSPSAARSGVGTALVLEIEKIAREYGLSHLQLDSSTTAEPFYSALGYRIRERGFHVLGSGLTMKCVKMWKALP